MQSPGAPSITHVLLAGASTRAAAESAARAGFAVTAVDAFGDLDQHPSVDALTVPRFTASLVACAARRIACDAVAYVASFENHPRSVSTLAAGRTLWGNTPAVLRRVRDPLHVMQALRERGLAAPEVDVGRGLSAPPDAGPDKARPTYGRWLVKPLASGGGYRVRQWRRDTEVPRGCYLQELVEGTPGSIVFVAAEGRAVPLGVSRQLIGERAFGGSGYRYCGNILGAAGDAQFARDAMLVGAACALASALTEAFDLIGVNGVDFVARAGVPYAIDVNPRWCASMELVEHAYGLSMFAAHAAACRSRVLPAFDLVRARQRFGAVGKAIVFARRDVTVGDTRAWLAGTESGASDALSIRDVPRSGQRIAAGRPVCTVFAGGRDAAACHAALVTRADRVYAQLAIWRGRVA